jgi:hypothetical protein
MRVCLFGVAIVTKVIIIPDENLDSFYNRTLQYLEDKYHTYPSNLHFSQSSKDSSNHSTSSLNTSQGVGTTRNRIPLGKRIG